MACLFGLVVRGEGGRGRRGQRGLSVITSPGRVCCTQPVESPVQLCTCACKVNAHTDTHMEEDVFKLMCIIIYVGSVNNIPALSDLV